MLAHLILNFTNQLRYFAFLVDFRSESSFAQYLDGVLKRPQKRMILRCSNNEMQFEVTLQAVMNSLKMSAPTAGLVFNAFSVRQIKRERLIRVPYAVAPCTFEHDFVGCSCNYFFVKFYRNVSLFQQQAYRTPNFVIATTMR